MLVKIKRRKSAQDKPYWQIFRYDGGKEKTVAAVLDELNYTDDLYDINGEPANRILWECSCMQKMCGACAMVINGVPALACNSFLKDVKGDTLTLEPLAKFPVIADLIVDRSIIEENLKKARIYTGQFSGIDDKEYEHCYLAAKCIKCGLCLEVCPNYSKGENFYGALFANDTYLTKSASKERAAEIKREYAKHFASGCSKCLSCQHICPVEIPTLASMLKMNR
ncbi:MAG: 2Fe-2S iron-sulfur cluster-binding protein [Candidatus Coproplasma sp.]